MHMQVDLVEDRVRLRIIGVALGTLLYIAMAYQTIGLFAAERPRPTTIQFASTMPSATQFRDCDEVGVDAPSGYLLLRIASLLPETIRSCAYSGTATQWRGHLRSFSAIKSVRTSVISS